MRAYWEVGWRPQTPELWWGKRFGAASLPEQLPAGFAKVMLWCFLLGTVSAASGASIPPGNEQPNPREFAVKGVVQAVQLAQQRLVVKHEAIPNYMDAMTMPFNVRDPQALQVLHSGDEIAFRLLVTDSESWIDQVRRIGTAAPSPERASIPPSMALPNHPRHPLLDYQFTNELGRPVSLGSFRGQALAITFFFTRCPIPDYCPRLSKNFQEASERLLANPHAPTNWHFLEISFDSPFDSPAVLKAYAEQYHYSPAHWSFLTGPPEQIAELARLSDVKFERDGPFINHNFRTQIIDANGHLQMVFPMGGDLSDLIVQEILKAAAPTNAPAGG
ncbi:Electron transport protein SCO1/SenC (modular protein) [Verrucomicrobia bacterium]|nr:Electron transport protein SCO1/SenC (modular protein) [Verrucomicrobiota bacterium]